MGSLRYVFASIAPALAMSHFCSMEPILAERLVDKNLTKIQIGIFFSIFPGVYVLCSSTMHVIPNKVEKRVRIISGYVLNCVAFFLVGPSLLLYLPDSLIIMAIG